MHELLCPYCARPPTDGGGPSRDHIFMKAMGGHSTVTACIECNKRVGREVEGELQRPWTLLNLIKQSAGRGLPLRGVLNDGRKASYDLATHELEFKKPVYPQQDQGTIQLSGSPDQVRGLLLGQGLKPAEIDLEMSRAQNVQLPEDTWINTSIIHNRDLADRLEAKVALGAGALAGDHAFIVSDLAGLLRDVLWARSSVYQRFDSGILNSYDSMINQVPIPPGARPVASLVPPDGASQVVFLPARLVANLSARPWIPA